MYIYFCEKCKKFEAFKSKTGNFKCPDCGQEYLSLGVTVDEWNEFSNDEMIQTIENARKPVIKTPVINTPVIKTPVVPDEEPVNKPVVQPKVQPKAQPADDYYDDDVEYFDDEEEYDEPPRKKKQKKSKRTNGNSGKTVKIILIIAAALIALVAIGVGVFFLITKIGDGADGELSDRKKEKIWEAVQPAVTGGLKNPESAEFGLLEDALIVEGNGVYHVTGEVKAKNGFGALVNEAFEVNVVEEDGKFITQGEVEFIESTDFQAKRKLYKDKQEREANGTGLLSASELDAEVQKQDLYVKSTKIIRKEDMYIATGDMLQAILYNNSDKKISSAVIAFAIWDSKNLPLKIKSPYMNTGSYIANVTFDNINMTSGQTYGEDSGYYIDEDINPQKVKAIVVSYETTDGAKWENPNYLDFVELYEGKELN